MKTNTEIITIENIFTDGLTAFNLLGDPLQYPQIHPLITKVEKLDDTNYLCYENAKILAFPYRFKYEVSISRPESSVVVMESEVQKGITLRLTFTLVYPNKIKEQIEVRGALFVPKILILKVEKAHRKMLRNIQKQFEIKKLSEK